MRRRIADVAFWIGLVLLAAAVAQGLGTRFDWPRVSQWSRWWWPLVIAGAALVLLSLLPQWRDPRATLGARTVRYGLNTAVMIVLVLGVIGVVEALSFRHSARLDLTENRRHSLSPQTVQILKGLKTKVTAVAFYRNDQPGKRVAEDLFKQYARYAGDNFAWKSVDPDAEPSEARAYGIDAYGTTVLTSKDRTEKLQDAEQEEKLTNALVKLTREGKRVIYVVQGHGEADPANGDAGGLSGAKAALEEVGYAVKPLVLARTGKIPDDASVVIVAGPRSDLFAPEIDALEAYLGRGGKLLVMLDPPVRAGQTDPEALKRFLARHGIEAANDVVIELNPLRQLATGGADIAIVNTFEPHPITRDLKIMALFPGARSVSVATKPPTGVVGQRLAMTSSDSFGDTDFAALRRGEVRASAGDKRGPLTVGVVVTQDKARLVTYGTSLLAANQYFGQPGNKDLFLNTVSWLAEEENLISIRPKDTKQTPVFLTSQQESAVTWLSLVILPWTFLVAGIVAAARRRASK